MKNWKHLLLGLGIAAAALYYTLRNVSLQELAHSFRDVDYLYLVPAVGFMLLSFVFRALRWRILLAPMKRAPASSLYSPLMIGFMGNILPARAGEFLRAYLLGKKLNVSFSGAFASIVVERLFDILALLFLFAWVFAFHADIIDPEATVSGVPVRVLAAQFGKLSAVLLAVLVAFVYLMANHKRGLMGFLQKLIRPLPQSWQKKTTVLLEEFSLGCMAVKDVTSLLKIAFYTVLVWTAIVLSYYPFFWAYGLSGTTLQSVVLVTLFVCVLITVLPTPAFLGSFNAAVLFALHEVLGVAEVTAVSFGVVCWAVNFGFILAAGLYFVLHDSLSVRKLVEIEEKGADALNEAGTR